MTTNAICTHSTAGHLFHPLCEDLSLFTRIAAIVFHILTLAVPLTFYYAVTWCFPSPATQPDDQQDLSQKAIESVQQATTTAAQPFEEAEYVQKEYSEAGLHAIAFARKTISGLSLPKTPEGKTPKDKEIYQLCYLWDEYLTRFQEALKNNRSNPWETAGVIGAFDCLMKITFAISCLTLDALPDHIAVTKQTPAEALTNQRSYQHRTFYYCTTAYHWARGQASWGRYSEYGDEEIVHLNPVPSKEHADMFYDNDYVHDSWRRLYNEFCRHSRFYVREADLKKADSRHVNWSRQDLCTANFACEPDTQPTFKTDDLRM